MKNSISIIMVTYNSLSKLKRCLISLEKIINRDDVIEFLILDNNSEKELKDYLNDFKLTNPKIKIILSENNLGCGGARKELMSIVKGQKILSLDPDIIVESETFLDKLILKEEEKSIGIVGCAGANINLNKIQFDLVEDNCDLVVDAIIGYCQFFDKNIIESGCEIDTYYFPNGEEDLDFCLQIKNKTNLKSYKLSLDNFGLIHDYNYTNRDNLMLRDKNFKYMFSKFFLYRNTFLGKIKFMFKSSVILKELNRKIGQLGILIRKVLGIKKKEK